MNTNRSLHLLVRHRRALLLAELAAWLHMFGKLHEDFLRGKHDLDIQIPKDAPDVLKNLLTGDWVHAVWGSLAQDKAVPQLQVSNITISTFIRRHRKQGTNTITGLLQDAHGRGSGIEKGVLNRFAPGQQGAVYPSTAAGKEHCPIDLDGIRCMRQEFYRYLTSLLENARTSAVPITRADRERIRRYFQSTVADTRRPLNDITLYDQTAASVALFKASLAQVLLTDWKDPFPKEQDDKFQWRVLRVGFNGPTFWGNARGISDLLARKDLATGMLNGVQDFLEHTCPLGGEVYRDENGSLFLVPDIAEILSYPLDEKTLEDTLQEIAADVLSGEARLELTLSDASRSMKRFGEAAMAALSPPVPAPDLLQSAWKQDETGEQNKAAGNAEVCTVCGLRPQGPAQKSINRKVCDVCEKRRQERSRDWVQKMGDGTSIWMSEIADDNGRLALLVGQFGLEHWLSGEALNSVMMMDPLRRMLVEERRDEQHQKVTYRFEIDYTQLLKDCRLVESTPNTPLDEQRVGLLDNLMLSITRGDAKNLGELYDLHIGDTDLNNPAQREGWRFALALMRQQPSFARIRRIWETTQGFWRDVRDNLKGPVGQAEQRLQITGEWHGLSPHDLGRFHAYELVPPGGSKINVVWDPDNKRFITADNLERIARLLGREESNSTSTAAQFLADNLSGQTLKIQEPGGYGNVAKSLGSLDGAFLETIRNSKYTPAIVILAEPRTFMALVPAEKALAVITDIRRRYQDEMGKVANRLPLRLGIVFAPQHTPVRALMDAGRRMLRGAPLPVSGWDVTAADAQNTGVVLRQDGREIRWRAPLTMGDGSPDAWYPYVYLQEETPGGRQRRVLSSNPWSSREQPAPLAHVCDLKPGDRVYFTPSTLDFIWLGSAAERVSIAYDSKGRRYELPRRPYLLDELSHLHEIWETLQKHLTVNQIYILRDLIETRRENWLPTEAESRKGGVFWRFCRDAIANVEWKNKAWSNTELDRWADYAVRGWLADTIELYLHIMKHKTQEEDTRDTAKISNPPVSADEYGPGPCRNRWFSSRQS